MRSSSASVKKRSSTSYDTSQEFLLARLHAVLRVLDVNARRTVIEELMTPFQRKSLERWIFLWRRRSVDGCEQSDSESCCASSVRELEPCESTSRTELNAATRKIVVSNGRFVSSIYVKWLEVLGPCRGSSIEALRDRTILLELKHVLLTSCAAEASDECMWLSVEDLLDRHGLDHSQLKARVLVPADVWVGTRLATPRVSLKTSIRHWSLLRQELALKWLDAFRGNTSVSQLFPTQLTLRNLWEHLRNTLTQIATEAGVERSCVDARLRKLEEEHSSRHGSIESRAIAWASKLLNRSTSILNRKKEKAERVRKHTVKHELRWRSRNLTRRLRAEKDMTMEDLLKHRC